MAIETEKLCNLKLLFLVKITVQKINSRKPGLFLNGIFLKKRQTGDGMI